MQVLLEDTNLLTWQFHDADIYSVSIDWEEDGEVLGYILCEVNYEENRSTLISLGIVQSKVRILFKNIYRTMTKVVGTCSGREEIITWVVEPHVVLSSKTEAELFSPLIQNRIECSCGSVYDIVCRAIYIEDAS